MFYFGKEKDVALREYVRVKDDLEAGRIPRAKEENALNILDLVNQFLTAKRRRVDSGELSARMWSEYHRAGEVILKHFGKTRVVTRPARRS